MKDIKNIIAQDLDISAPEALTDEQMILHIADRVDQLLKAEPDLLMSYLYRLDVEEKVISAAIKESVMPLNVTFAHLIWERQKRRLALRKQFKQDPIEGWEF